MVEKVCLTVHDILSIQRGMACSPRASVGWVYGMSYPSVGFQLAYAGSSRIIGVRGMGDRPVGAMVALLAVGLDERADVDQWLCLMGILDRRPVHSCEEITDG
jgi:hypothetical protein